MAADHGVHLVNADGRVGVLRAQLRLHVAREFQRRFAGNTITKVLTIEASGIAIACAVARQLGVPVVFAKKSKSINLDGDSYVAEVESFTHKKTNQVIVSKKYLMMVQCVIYYGVIQKNDLVGKVGMNRLVVLGVYLVWIKSYM